MKLFVTHNLKLRDQLRERFRGLASFEQRGSDQTGYLSVDLPTRGSISETSGLYSDICQAVDELDDR